jgi:hypothetical protein
MFKGTEMTKRELVRLWEFAAVVDPSLRTWRRSVSTLNRKQLRAKPYARTTLFSRMMKGQVSLFTNFPVPVKHEGSGDRRSSLLEVIKNGFPPRRTAGVQVRSSHCTRMKVSELMRCWERGRSIVSVTDLHFRKTKFAESIDTSALSDFNILCDDPFLIENLEMMTVVISSKCNLTDTHTDDCDGSNHCFLGKKLWLCWDRMEGRAKGFEDLDRDEVESFARFELPTFFSLPSSQWFVIKENETLFLPGSLSHKVITLQDYVGVGSFHVALPSYVRALRRWILYDSLDVQPHNLLGRINRAVIGKIRRLEKEPAHIREKWGLPYLKPSIERWLRNERSSEKTKLLANPAFDSFLAAARKV